MKPRIEIVALLHESFDTDAFVRDAAAFSPRSLVIVGTIHGYGFALQPPGLEGLRPPRFLPFRLPPRLNYILHPFLLPAIGLGIFLYFLRLGLRFRVQTVFVSDSFASAVVGVLRRLGVFKGFVYFAGDWLQGGRAGGRFWSRLGKGLYFPVTDRIACRCSDVTANLTAIIAASRRAYWGRQIPQKEILYVPPLVAKPAGAGAGVRRNKILFLGAVRDDSGLELVVRALPALRRGIPDLALKIVGASNPVLAELQRTAAACGVAGAVECTGFGERARFGELFADCFCGVNLITAADSYTGRTIPAKVMDYLQYLLPVLATANIGPLAETIREGGLGIVTTPDAAAVEAAVASLYGQHKAYVGRLQAFLATRPYTGLAQLVTEAG